MKKFIRTLEIGVLASAFFWTVPVYAETETAGSSLKEEQMSEKAIELYSEEKEKLTGEWKQNKEGWWYYEYSNGTSPKISWRKIDGKWYYFNSKGYWIDDNTYEEGTLKGIDVSAWQAEVDWEAVKNDGIEFAMIRLGYNTNNLDKYYQRNMKEAEKVQIPVGVYYYSKATNEEEAVRDAEFVIENLKGYKVSYPVAIDLEDKAQENLSKEEVGKIAKAFVDEVASAGYTPMVYANEYWHENHIDWSLLEGVEKWIASYAVIPNRNIERGIWQCCDTGLVDGVDGNTDINFGNKDYTKEIEARTEPLESYYKRGLWMKNDRGWWYQYKKGGYPYNQWESINGKWYWFDKEGYVVTGWQFINGYWYYLDESGAMTTGWQSIDGYWYYLKSSGVMAIGWESIGGAWYHMDNSGVMQTGWQQLNGNWYYLKPSGVMAIGWERVGGAWYHMDSLGIMQTGWQSISGSWYYMNKSGAMQTGWLYLDGNWYYLKSSGAMVTGRHYIDGKWYSFSSSGVMQ